MSKAFSSFTGVRRGIATQVPVVDADDSFAVAMSLQQAELDTEASKRSQCGSK